MIRPIGQRPERRRTLRRRSLGKGGLALREATPPAVAARLVARAPGKETLSFRSDGILGEWRFGMSPCDGRLGRARA